MLRALYVDLLAYKEARKPRANLLHTVYALGLYVDPAAVKQKVAPKFRGQAPEALSTSQQLLDGARRSWPQPLRRP